MSFAFFVAASRPLPDKFFYFSHDLLSQIKATYSFCLSEGTSRTTIACCAVRFNFFHQKRRLALPVASVSFPPDSHKRNRVSNRLIHSTFQLLCHFRIKSDKKTAVPKFLPSSMSNTLTVKVFLRTTSYGINPINSSITLSPLLLLSYLPMD